MILNKVLIILFLPILASAYYSDFKKSYLVDHCDKIYSLACFKLEAASWIDKFGVSSEINIIPGVSILQNSNSVSVHSNDIAQEVTREFPNDRNNWVNQFFIKKLENFLSGHSLKLNLWKTFNNQGESAFEDIETARKDKAEKGSNGGMNMILISGAMILGVMVSLTMGGLTALAGKALLTGLIALVLSAIIGLKELVSQPKTYIAQPVPVPASPANEVWEDYSGHNSRMTQELPKGLQPEFTPA